MNRLEEYGIENGHNSNGNGNGNGDHRPIFKLAPVQDKLTFTILDTRRKAHEDHRLKRSAKLFFDYILDLSLNPAVNDRPGVVTISERRIASTFRVSTRTIYTWKRQVESCGYFWMGKKFVPNMWPLDVYHVTAIDKPKERDHKPTADGMWGNGNVRSGPPNPGNGARKPGQPMLPLTGSKSTPAPDTVENAKSPIISGAASNSLPVPAEENFGSQPKKTSAASRNKFRRTAEVNFGGQPKQISADSRSEFRAAAEANCSHNRGSDKRFETLEVKGESAPPQDAAFERWKKSLEKKFDRELEKLQADFKRQISAARSATAKAELKRRLAAVEAQLYGPPVADEPAAPVLPRTAKPAEPTPEEILAGAQYLVSIGKEKSLTASQRRALKAA